MNLVNFFEKICSFERYTDLMFSTIKDLASRNMEKFRELYQIIGFRGSLIPLSYQYDHRTRSYKLIVRSSKNRPDPIPQLILKP